MKYFISDLDGTLLQDKTGIHKEDVKAIKTLANIPMGFGIATGRDVGFCSSLMNTAQINPDVMIVNNGGSLFVHNKKIVEVPISLEAMEAIIQFVKPFVGSLHPFVNDEQRTFYMMRDLYSTEAWKDIKQELFYLGNIYDKDLLTYLKQCSLPIAKVSIYVTDKTQTMYWLDILKQHFSKYYEVLMTASNYIEFTAKGVHKGSALLAFERHSHISPQDVIFIGDGENDIAMMDMAGYSFAMKSASDEVKHHADQVVTSIREAIEMVCSNYKNI